MRTVHDTARAIDTALPESALPEIIPLNEHGNPLGWPVSNDIGQPAVWRDPTLRVPQASRDRLSVGLFIGNGMINSLLPKLPVDLTVNIDIDPLPTHWQRYLREGLLANEEAVDQVAHVTSADSPIAVALQHAEKLVPPRRTHYTDIYTNTPDSLPHEWLDVEIDRLNKLHYTRGTDNYRHARAAALEKPAAFGTVDVTNQAQMEHLGDVLRSEGGEITYFSGTNVREWMTRETEAQFIANLGALPMHPEALIHYATSDWINTEAIDFAPRWPSTHGVQGLAAYAQQGVAIGRYTQVPAVNV